MPADLHIHSTASDGTLSPTQVVEESHRVGLAAIAPCDHDTVGGIDEALEAGKRLGVCVLTGVEINTDVGDRDVHILGYRFDPSDAELSRKLSFLKEARHERGEQMVRQLRDLGMEIDIDEVLAHSHDAPLGRPHVAAILVAKGYVPSIEVAFGKYLCRGRPGFVDRMRFSPAQAIALIRAARGIAVIAHPAKVKDPALVESLVDQGLMGVEVYHTQHDAKARKRWRRFAERHRLLITGGSDSHGPEGTTDVAVGSITIDDDDLDRLLAAPAFQVV